MKWFVMLRNQTGETPIPMITPEEDIALFESEEKANYAGRKNVIGESFGFKVYEW